ncbi:hypothetical protein JHK82_034168 [Glycine max]|nr:hypothetical protein JHK85_034880 [Glycine max]KAG4986543.1 hypothetical protein JHK86_034234 [Glycine max]KAG5119748.1 hypothetical protein JHK82_034168 [Glycine max]KAG5140737.1 hypothetical protein JHK84_034505 [Glycine max]
MGGSGGRNLDETPTWAIAVVCFVLLSISITIEHIFHVIGKWFKQKHKRALYESLEKIKSELMLLGFISLLLTVGQGLISRICISEKVAGTFHPCSTKRVKHSTPPLDHDDDETNGRRLLAAILSSDDESHRRILALGARDKCAAQMRRWKRWEVETKTAEYQFSHDPERFRFARETSFGRRHLSFWTQNTVLVWIVCFFRQFVQSVPKVDYLTLRHGFMMIVLLVGTKLQVIITKMGQRIQQRGEVVKGVPLVQPGDDLFWFNKPRLILYLINFVLFQGVVIRISMGIFVQFLCSYVTLPLYALVTQMGSTMKPTIFNKRVATALRKWHHTAKKNVKQNRGLRLQTPSSTRPTTPNHPKSQVNFLRRYHSEMAPYPSSPIRFDFEANLSYEVNATSSSIHHHEMEMGHQAYDHAEKVDEPSSTLVGLSLPQREIDIEHGKEFSFDNKE